MKTDFDVSPSDRRLLKGYGPGIFLAVVFLLMAVLVPTVAPQVITASNSGQSVTSSGSAPPSGGSNVNPGGLIRGKRGGTSNIGGTSSTGPDGIASKPAAGKVAGCHGPQVSGDPYSPPCVTFSGSNGGATSPGVTGTTINVTYRIPPDAEDAAQAVQQIASKYNAANFNDTPAQIERTLQDLATYFNKHFQFYGRKIALKSFKGSGQILQEILGAGQAAANADALTAARTDHAFADVSAISQPYAQALTNRHVVNIGAPYMSNQWFTNNAPYSWSFEPNCSDLAAEGGNVAIRQIIHQPVTWAGSGVKNGQSRRIALIVPDNPVYQQCAKVAADELKRAGHPFTDQLSYTLDLSQLSSEANSMEQRLVSDNITSVGFAGDPITLVYLTGDMHNAGYEPEFLNMGVGFTDLDIVGQLFQQEVWAHAAGITNNGTEPPYGSSLGYFAVKSVDPGFAPSHVVDQLYEDLYVLALGIQLAGPDLTPQNFERGMFNYPGGDGEFGPWTFHPGGHDSFTTQHEFRYEWWDPTATSAYDDQPGTWVGGHKWYTAASVPTGPPPVFPHGVQ